jgi:hypothetical protein
VWRKSDVAAANRNRRKVAFYQHLGQQTRAAEAKPPQPENCGQLARQTIE